MKTCWPQAKCVQCVVGWYTLHTYTVRRTGTHAIASKHKHTKRTRYSVHSLAVSVRHHKLAYTCVFVCNASEREKHEDCAFVLDLAEVEREKLNLYSNRQPTTFQSYSIEYFLTLSLLFDRSHTHTPVSFWLLLFYGCYCRSNSSVRLCKCVRVDWNCFVHVVAVGYVHRTQKCAIKRNETKQNRKLPFQSHASFSETFRNVLVTQAQLNTFHRI